MGPRIATSLFLTFAAFVNVATAQSALQTLTGSNATERFGTSVAFVGDVNGDGISDYAVGAPWPELISTGYGIQYTKIGYAELRSGADGSVIQHKDGLYTGDQFGVRVSRAGDLDGDGVPDWLACSLDSGGYQTDIMFPGTAVQGGGHVRAYSGATGALLEEQPGGVGYQLYFDVDGVGDVDGDGRDDILFGHTTSIVTFNWSTLTYFYTPVGAASVYSGQTGVMLWLQFGTNAGDDMGYSVSRAGDVNLDGYADFLVTARGTENAYLYAGGSLTLLRTHASPAPGSEFGTFVNDVGDLDADGIDDYAVGTSPTNGGIIHVYSGSSGTPLTPVAGPIAGAMVGSSAQAIGDVDLDGVVDLAVRGHLTNSQYFNVPYHAAVILSGANYELRNVLLGSTQAAGHASGLSGGADVNLDGQPDLLVGSYDNANQVGMVEVVSTTPAGLAPYGAGTPGCAGPQRLTGDSVPVIGNLGFELRGNHAPPSGVSLVLISDAADPGSDPLGIGVNTLVNIFQASELLAFSGTASASCLTTASAPIPNHPWLVGVTYYAQEFRAWPSAFCTPSPFGLSSTEGLTITIQP